MVSKRFLRTGAAVAVAAAMGMGTAVAQNVDSGSVQVQAVVLAPTVVTPGPTVDLGQVLQGQTGDVASDGSGFVQAAYFDITGSALLDWQLTVAYADLPGPGAELIAIAAPAGSQICFNGTIGNQAPCTPAGASPLGIPKADHAGDGTAWVGFSFAVPGNATPGAYVNALAITLTAEALLGT